MSISTQIDSSKWEHECVPQSIIFESFRNGNVYIMWGVSLWPTQESFFVDVVNSDDVTVSPWGASQKYSNFKDAFDYVLAYLQMNEAEYTALTNGFRTKYGNAIIKMLSKYKD